jgi:hypothetical protein
VQVSSNRCFEMDNNEESGCSSDSSTSPQIKKLSKALLLDSGYKEQEGYMTPFRNCRYHTDDFKGVDLNTLDCCEKINYIHSKLRNIIERRFGILKERWHILNKIPLYKRVKQNWVLISCFALDNYLWLRDHGPGLTYEPSEWVRMNAGDAIDSVRELVSWSVWGYPEH